MSCVSQPTKRIEFMNSKTPLPDFSEPSKNPADRTPLPIEYPKDAAYLPKNLSIRIPFDDQYKLTNAYGFKSRAWTHRTIANKKSANDFFALDIVMPVGTPIFACADGRILTSMDRSTIDSYGKYIVIDHGNGFHSIYAHLSKLEFVVNHGNPKILVKKGQKIAESGQSGGQPVPHLHFGLHKNAHISQSGCDVGGLTVVPEPLGDLYGLRAGQMLGK